MAISYEEDGDPWTGEQGANGPELNDNLEHYYVAVVTADTISLYIDGALTESSPFNLGLSGLGLEFVSLGNGYPRDQNWAGTVDELRIWKVALPADQIAAQHEVGPSVVVPEPSVFAFAGSGLAALLLRQRRRA